MFDLPRIRAPYHPIVKLSNTGAESYTQVAHTEEETSFLQNIVVLHQGREHGSDVGRNEGHRGRKAPLLGIWLAFGDARIAAGICIHVCFADRR